MSNIPDIQTYRYNKKMLYNNPSSSQPVVRLISSHPHPITSSGNLFCIVVSVPHSSVQACVAAADEDHCVVQSLGVSAVWLRFLACEVSMVSAAS